MQCIHHLDDVGQAGLFVGLECALRRSTTRRRRPMTGTQTQPLGLPVVHWFASPLFEQGPNLTAFCHALRSSTLQALNLRSFRLWQDPAAADELMAALVGHPTLRELSLHDSVGGVRGAQTYAWAPSDDELIAAVRQRLLNKLCGNGTGMSPGGQLASLITHTSALQKLDLSGNNLGEDGLGLIIYVLPRSSTLKEFVYHVSYEDEFISREFARSVILPAVRLNISLRRLDFGPYGETLPELAEAQAIVAARTQDAGYHRCLRWF